MLSYFFGMKDEDISSRNVTPSIDFQSMGKQELQELQQALKKAVATSKVNSGIVAAVPAAVFGGLIFGIVGPVQGIIIGLIIFFAMYEIKLHEYWRLFFSSSYHFYTPIKARHLYLTAATYMAEYGYFGMMLAPLKWSKTSREFADANGGRKMNEQRALFELKLIDKLLKG